MTYLIRDEQHRVKAFLQTAWDAMDPVERALYSAAVKGMKPQEKWPLEGACRALELVEALRELKANPGPAYLLLPLSVVAQLSRYGGQEAKKIIEQAMVASESVAAPAPASAEWGAV